MQKRINGISIKIRILLFIALFGLMSLQGCGPQNSSKTSNSKSKTDDADFQINETAYERARKILDKYPEKDVTDSEQDSESVSGEGSDGTYGTDEYSDSVTSNIPLEEVKELMDFVDSATIDLMSEPTSLILKLPEVTRVCSGDGIDQKSQKYFENVQDECLMPKMETASQIFKIRFSFARCIFEQENRSRDRLAHNNNGNGLAQIVNRTMIEINKRWTRGDSIAALFKSCLQYNSNRSDKYLHEVENLIVPSSYNKKDIFDEAANHPPSTRINPLYRDDSVCLGLMTMAIKVQEANSRRKKQSTISEQEIARRYNGSKLQQRYARDVVACVERYKRKPK